MDFADRPVFVPESSVSCATWLYLLTQTIFHYSQNAAPTDERALWLLDTD